MSKILIPGHLREFSGPALDDKLKELGLYSEELSWVAAQVIAAYSDTSRLDYPRNLAFFCINSVNGPQLIEIISKIVPRYNDFDGKVSVTKLVDIFGDDSEYFVARESSPAIYVKPRRQIKFWERNLAELANEATFEPELGMFRFWWD